MAKLMRVESVRWWNGPTESHLIWYAICAECKVPRGEGDSTFWAAETASDACDAAMEHIYLYHEKEARHG